MRAQIIEADRASAHAASHPLSPGICRSPHACERGAQAIADARAAERRTVAAYLVDRADQYVTDSASWIGLVDASHALMDGEFEAAVAHGELEDADLLRRVDSWARRSGR